MVQIGTSPEVLHTWVVEAPLPPHPRFGLRKPRPPEANLRPRNSHPALAGHAQSPATTGKNACGTAESLAGHACGTGHDDPWADRRRRLRGHLARARRFDEMIRSGEAANAAEVSRMEGLTRARVSQLLGLLRLAPAILDDLEDPRGLGPVPNEGRLRRLSMLPNSRQDDSYAKLLAAEFRCCQARQDAVVRSRAHLPRRGFAHLFEQARRYQAMLDAGDVRALEEIGQMEGNTGDRVGQVIGLLQLAPDIIECIDQPKGESQAITYKELLRISRMPDLTAQRRAFYGRSAACEG